MTATLYHERLKFIEDCLGETATQERALPLDEAAYGEVVEEVVGENLENLKEWWLYLGPISPCSRNPTLAHVWQVHTTVL